METLYLDSNILLNVLLEEEGLAESSYRLLQDIEEGKYAATTSLLTIMEIHRVLQKQGKTENKIAEAIRKIPGMGVEIIIPEREEMISAYDLIRTLRLDPADAIHLASATASATVFVTRDAELSRKIKKTIRVAQPEQLLR